LYKWTEGGVEGLGYSRPLEIWVHVHWVQVSILRV
jgi:hypothetical protein